MEMHPGRLEDLDLFACGSTLGNLLRFTEGSDRPFRLLVNVVGGVVHLIRREKSPTERILGIRGFGHTFPEANTTWDFEVRGSTTHQRILRYRLGGISILIRFEADGYIPSSYEAVSSSHISAGIEPGDVEDQLNGLRVKPQRKGSDTAKHHDLVVRYGGDLVAQDRVFDLKTRASYHKDKNIVDEELPRLWLRQMEHFVLAFHRHHLFSDVTVHDIKDRVIRWERDHQPLLSSLVKLLQDIMQKARERVDGKFEIVYSGQGPLEIREQLADVGDVLSEKALGDWELWLNRQDSCGESDEEREINARPVDEPNVVGYSSDSDSGLEDFTACGTGCSYCGRCSK